MEHLFSIKRHTFFFLFYLFFMLFNLFKALADVKLIPPKQYKMQKKDMNRIKEVLEDEVKFSAY